MRSVQKGGTWLSVLRILKNNASGTATVLGSNSAIIAAVVPFFNTGEFYPEEEISNA